MERTNNDPISVSLLSVMEYAPIFIFSFIGGIVAAVFASKVNPKKMFVFGMSVLAISFSVEGLSTSFWITSFMRFGTGICLACVNIVVGTLMIQLVPENMIGRVNGTIFPLFMGAMLIGTSLAGGLKEMTSVVICILYGNVAYFIGNFASATYEDKRGYSK